jgi:hypothetical protein
MDAIQRGKLVAVTDAGLPLAPEIEFGMFSATALPSHAQNLLEVAMASLPISEKRC